MAEGYLCKDDDNDNLLKYNRSERKSVTTVTEIGRMTQKDTLQF